jgi:hypothetical protein
MGACQLSEPAIGEEMKRSHGEPGSRCAKTSRPSAVHEGQRSSPAVVVAATGAEPFLSETTKMSKPLPRSAAKAMRVPSGDHAGSLRRALARKLKVKN